MALKNLSRMCGLKTWFEQLAAAHVVCSIYLCPSLEGFYDQKRQNTLIRERIGIILSTKSNIAALLWTAMQRMQRQLNNRLTLD